MKSLFSGKIWIILLALAALAGLVVLTSGLSGMKFDQPRMVGLENLFGRGDLNAEDTPTATWLRYLLWGMFIVLFLLMLGPIRPQTSRNLVKQLVRFTAFTFVLALVLSRIAQSSPLFRESEEPVNPATSASNSGQPAFADSAVTAQQDFWITSVIVIVLGVLAIVFFNRLVDRWFQPKTGLNEIADIARTTLDDLSSTKESKNAIIRCYTRMNAAVDKYRGITRDAAMTPAEFARHLEIAGLPRDAVHDLTQVFERVRYGGQSVSAEEIEEARNCLTSILRACEAQK